MPKAQYTTLEAAGHEIRISSPSKVYLPAHEGRGPYTKLDLAQYLQPSRARKAPS